MDTLRETDKEKADSVRWIIGAGICAVSLAVFAYSVDRYMDTAQKRDIEHAATMHELRSAQTSLPSRVTDDRQKNRIPKLEVAQAQPETSDHSHGHGEHEDHDH